MIILVCGGRDFSNRTGAYKVLDLVHKNMDVSLVIHGDAHGADRIERDWALLNSIEHRPYPADWDKFGKSAGFRRNQIMAYDLKIHKDGGEEVLVVAFPGGKGTAHMVNIARSLDLPIMSL